MKQLYKLLFLFLIYPNLLVAQNLVPNPSFEDTVSCPTGTNQLVASIGWFSARGSSDFFHSCANSSSPIVGAPYNTAGFQNPFHGEAYAGIVTYTTFNPNAREYIGIELVQPLQPGTRYFASAYISRADSIFGGEPLNCASNNFGFSFSTKEYNFTPYPVNNLSHIHSDSIITNSINWTQISGSFMADSAYTYLYMGNFYDGLNTSITTCTGTAYYYIDAVCVSANNILCDVNVASPQQIQKPQITIYPNPASTFLAISNLTNSCNYTIFSSTGKPVRNGTVNIDSNVVSLNGMPNGLFLFYLENTLPIKFFIHH